MWLFLCAPSMHTPRGSALSSAELKTSRFVWNAALVSTTHVLCSSYLPMIYVIGNCPPGLAPDPDLGSESPTALETRLDQSAMT